MEQTYLKEEILRSLNQIMKKEEYDPLNQNWMFAKNWKDKNEFDDKPRKYTKKKEKEKEKSAPAILCYTWNWWTENATIWRTKTSTKPTSVTNFLLDEKCDKL